MKETYETLQAQYSPKKSAMPFASKKTMNTDQPIKKSKVDAEPQSLPEVSSERYYQTTKSLGISKLKIFLKFINIF